MPGLKKARRRIAKSDEHGTETTLIGGAYEMPVQALEAMILADETPIDFHARQDSISETRRSPGAKLMPKLKRTGAKPGRAPETNVKL